MTLHYFLSRMNNKVSEYASIELLLEHMLL